MGRILLTICFVLFCRNTTAEGLVYACFEAASSKFRINDVRLLMAMAKAESNFNPNAINKSNRDGSIDYGMMQHNSQHLPLFEAAGFEKEDLFDPCTSIYLAAHNLSGCIKRHGRTWRAVGCYNAGSGKNREGARKTYVSRVKKAYGGLMKEGKGTK